MPAFEHITDSELAAHPGKVLSLDAVEIVAGRPNKGVLAGIWLPDGDGPGLPKIITVCYHFGRKTWALAVDHSIQAATRYDPVSLPDAIAAFESMFGVELPDIRVIEYGVGVYGAKTRLAQNNPWALANGGFYQVQSPTRGVRRFVADVRNGRTLISFLDSDGYAAPLETYDPVVVLSMADWRSLKQLPA